MKPFLLKLRTFKNDSERAESHKILKMLLGCLVKINLLHLSFRKYPLLYKSGVRYIRKNHIDFQEFEDLPTALELGGSDCGPLTAWRVAELRNNGILAKPNLLLQTDGNFYQYHVRVKYQDGTIEDPSKRLGM